MSKHALRMGFGMAVGLIASTTLDGCASGDASPSPAEQAEQAAGGALGTGGTTSNAGGDFATGGVPDTSSGGSSASGGLPGAGGALEAGGSSGSGGASETGGSDAGKSYRPPCISKASQVVMIGDSYVTGFAGTPATQPALTTLIPEAANYRNYAVAGISMASGGIPLGPPPGVQYVPQEFDPAAVNADPDIKLVIMTGGGNDILLPPPGSPDCKNLADNTTTAACTKIVQDALDASTTLTKNMAAKGVKDMIYFFYPHLPSVTGGLGGTTSNQLLDYSYTKAGPLCDSAEATTNGQIRCHFIDTREPFSSTGSIAGAAPWTNISNDGVHPTAAGQAIIAGEIKKVMDANCLGKDASSGCCEP